MGKSPGKWIKALLSKKSSRSHTSKARDAMKTTLDRDYSGRKGPAATEANSPVISDPILVNTDRSGVIQDIGKSTSYESALTGELPSSGKQDSGKLETAGLGEANGSDSRKEQAAVKAQAAFRGYLARRDFRILKGIIRLQAVVRGYLVRRQAVSTLYAMHGLVQFQALVRGWEVRRSGIGLEISTKYRRRKSLDVKNVVTWREKVTRSAYISKNVLSTSATTPLRIQYYQELPNSVMSWMERWSSSCFWRPIPRPKKTTEIKTQMRRTNYTMDTESGRSKRIVRRNQTSNTESGLMNVVSETEKSKRASRKVSSFPADAMQEHPQSELEKVKRNLRRVSNLATEQASDRPDESEKHNFVKRKSTGSLSEVPDQANEATTVDKPKDEDPVDLLKTDVPKPTSADPAETMNKDVPSLPETNLDVESSPKEMSLEVPVEVLGDQISATDATLLPSFDKQENTLMNEDLNPKEEQICYGNQKKRRSSFPAKSEYKENGLQETPALPSYMAATESAKAKLRGLNSPRFGSESSERNGFTRRHSLPSSTNGTVSLHSPRTQRLGQASAKGSTKGDRTLLSSRDGHDKPIQVEWRR